MNHPHVEDSTKISLTSEEEELWRMIIYQQEQDDYYQMQSLLEPTISVNTNCQ